MLYTSKLHFGLKVKIDQKSSADQVQVKNDNFCTKCKIPPKPLNEGLVIKTGVYRESIFKQVYVCLLSVAESDRPRIFSTYTEIYQNTSYTYKYIYRYRVGMLWAPYFFEFQIYLMTWHRSNNSITGIHLLFQAFKIVTRQVVKNAIYCQ